MTNEEAIKKLQGRIDTALLNNEQFPEELKIAISAIEKRKRACENCVYFDGSCVVAELLIYEHLRTDDICCEEWVGRKRWRDIKQR